MPNPQLGPRHDLAIRLGSIERQIKALLTMPTGQALSSYQSDGSIGWSVYMSLTSGLTQSVWYNGPGSGATKVNGQWPMFMSIGQLTSGGSPSGVGMVTARPDGSVSATIGNKGVGIIDHNGAIIWSESETSFGGIKSPNMMLFGGTNTNVSTWPNTTATTWTSIWQAAAPVLMPQIGYYIQSYAPAGVTANFRVTVGGTQVDTWTTSNNTFTQQQQSGVNLPSAWTFGSAPVFSIDAEVVSGSGTVYAALFGMWGAAAS